MQSLLYGVLAVQPFIFNIIMLLIMASVVMSWVDADPYNPYVQLTRQLTEPLYHPFRRFTQGFSGPIDLAPLCVLFALIFFNEVLTRVLNWLITLLG